MNHNYSCLGRFSRSAFRTFFAALLFWGIYPTQAAEMLRPPLPPREFRGVWVATVANIDWPSRKDLTVAEQKAELITILDRAQRMNCNAIVFQVRPMCDAFYASQIEPWSEYLTGEMGKAPAPAYDPLAFAVAEAHERGLELHAWFNPYRVRATAATGPVAPNHISKKRPDLIRTWGKYLWLDPAEPATREYSLEVLRDVVRRYDIDAVHFDDYFYPYPEEGTPAQFPDDAAWQKYQAKGGTLTRADWRRDNVNTFIQMVRHMVRMEKSWVKFGISPFGIWQSGQPTGIRGLSAYSELSADSRKWLAKGWVDYLAPQLYWPIDAKEQSFPVLLKWWVEQNDSKRYVWPGLNLEHKKSTNALEAIAQIELARKQAGASGHILWHSKTVANKKNIADALESAYAQPALIPAFPWLNATPPALPKVELKKTESGLKASWQPGAGPVWLWVVQTKTAGGWSTEILPGANNRLTIKSSDTALQAVAVTAVNRFGNLSAPAVVEVK